MSESLGKAVLELAADRSSLEKDIDGAEAHVGSKAKSMGSKFKSGLQSALVPAIGVLAAVGAGAKKTVDAASDLSEQINKTSVVFGDSAKDIQAWSKTTASSIGISQRAALEAAGVFGNMLVPMGFSRKEAAGMSKRMVQLAADMASFNNASPEETLDALRAGLAGETEPLRRFGVFLNDARLKQEALNLGLYKGTGPLSAQAKAQATYAILLKDTKDAQGDFAKTSDSAANASRIQAAEAEDLNAKIGQGLLPVYQQLQQMLLKVTGFMSEHTDVVKIAAAVIASLAVAVIAINAGMKLYAAGAAVVTAAQWLWNASLFAFPLVWIIAAILAVIAIIVLAITHWDDIKAAVAVAWEAIKNVTVSVANAIVSFLAGVWDAIKSAASAVWNAIKTAITFYLNAIKTAILTYVNIWKTVITTAWHAIKDSTVAVWNAIKSFLSGAWNAIKSAVSSAGQAVVSAVKNAWDGARDAAVTIVNAYVDFVKNIPERSVSALAGIVGGLVGKAKEAWQAFRDAAGDKVEALIGFVKNIPERIVSALGNVGRLLYDAGVAIIQGLIDGLKAKMGELLGLVGGIADKIKGLKGPLPKDRVLLVEEGQAIIEGLERGMTTRLNGLLARVADMAPTISQTVSQSIPAAVTPAGPSGPLVNVEHMEVTDRFDEARFASDLAWRVNHA